MTNTLIRTLAVVWIASASLSAQPTAPPGESIDPVIQEAVAKFESGQDAEALLVLETLKDRENPPPQGLALLGALYLQAGRPLDALDVLEPLAAMDPPDSAVLYNAGRAAASLGQFERASGLYERSIQVQPSSPARRELGLILGANGMYPQALALLKPWAERNPSDIEVRLAAAFSALELGRVPDAEQLLSDLPQGQPQVGLLWGRLLLIKGDPWGALNMLAPTLEIAPDAMQLDIRRVLAEAHAAVGQASEAVAVLSGYSETNPSVALQLSQAQYQSGELDGALATLQPFAEALVDNADTGLPADLAGRMVLHYGRFLAMKGEHEAALPYLVRATEMDPGEKQGWQMLGQTLAGLGRRDDAQIALERFQEISKAEISASKRDMQEREEREDPTLATIRKTYNLMSEERFEEALEAIRQERAIARNDLRPLLLEGRILAVLGRHDEALQVAVQAVQAAPENADALYLRGTVHMAQGDRAAAEADFRQALSIQPRHTATMNDLAVLLIDDGNTAEARELLQQVLALNPNDPVAASNLSGLEG